MHLIRRTSLICSAAAFSMFGLFVAACNDASSTLPTTPNAQGGASTSSPTTGGVQAMGGNAQSNGQGGTSQASNSQTGQGGSNQTAQGGSSNATGGASSSSNSATGGAATGGSNATATGGAKPTGGSTSTSTGGAKAVGGAGGGGATATGGTKAAGGATTATGGTKAAGGSSATTATGGGTSTSSCTTPEEQKFAFFLASQKALQDLSGSPDGYGGDLGGITGADAICQKIAEKSSPCQKSKTWHAFLSTSTVNAKDRIGTGPWYDRRGRLLAQNLANLLTERPTGADAAIKDDLPNEDGVPNHSPSGTLVDNHEILTGTGVKSDATGVDGNVYKQTTGGMTFPGGSTSCGPKNEETWTVEAATCWGWTTKEPKGCPRVGHSWPRQGSGVGWISVWNEGGCAPGGTLDETTAGGGLDGTRRVGSAGGYGGFYCFAVVGN